MNYANWKIAYRKNFKKFSSSSRISKGYSNVSFNKPLIIHLISFFKYSLSEIFLQLLCQATFAWYDYCKYRFFITLLISESLWVNLEDALKHG